MLPSCLLTPEENDENIFQACFVFVWVTNFRKCEITTLFKFAVVRVAYELGTYVFDFPKKAKRVLIFEHF